MGHFGEVKTMAFSFLDMIMSKKSSLKVFAYQVDMFCICSFIVLSFSVVVASELRVHYYFVLNQNFFSIRIFFTDTDDSHGSRGREGAIFYSILPLPPAHEH